MPEGMEESGVEWKILNWNKKQTEIIYKYKFLSAKEMVFLINISRRSYLRKECSWLTEVTIFIFVIYEIVQSLFRRF